LVVAVGVAPGAAWWGSGGISLASESGAPNESNQQKAARTSCER